MPTASTPTGVAIAHCDRCDHTHPVTRGHCRSCGHATAFLPAGTCLTCDPITAGTCRADNLLCSGDYPHRDRARARFLIDHTTGLIIEGTRP
jgi:hypothetical protein